MNAPAKSASGSASTPLEGDLELSERPREFERLWRGFMTARATLGLVLLLLQGSIFMLASPHSSTPLLICLGYFVASLSVRVLTHPTRLGNTFDAQWWRTVGVDVAAFSGLQLLQSGSINYAPLFALPVLMASILGSMMMAMAAAAGVTLLLFAYAAWLTVQNSADPSSQFLQAALAGAGCFVISFVASQFANRLANAELSAQRSQGAAKLQRQINALVVASLTDGVLVVAENLALRSANPAAQVLLDLPDHRELKLSERSSWHMLTEVVNRSFTSQAPQLEDITILNAGQGSRTLRVRTQLTPLMENNSPMLCVVFMQDQRELQARLRAEKLASMGRMSAAVAHEIRNPLAAILQANALLTEEMVDPKQQRLGAMVQQNALRLERIVHDVLHLAQAAPQEESQRERIANLVEAVSRICHDWQFSNAIGSELLLDLPSQIADVWFEPEHLRRVLMNLLDNALRYASRKDASIQISLLAAPIGLADQATRLSIWSDGKPLERSVEQHLFEPFFSSESRSSGLGLYICRELCARHAATINYERSSRAMSGHLVEGNEFCLCLRGCSDKPSQRADHLTP